MSVGEPLALEVALARYVASMPEDARIPLADLAERFGVSVERLRGALEAVMEVEDRDLATISGVAVDGEELVKYLPGGYEPDFRRPMRLSPVQGRAALLALDLVSGAVDPRIRQSLKVKIRAALSENTPEVEVGGRFEEDATLVAAIERGRRERLVVEIRYPSGEEVETRPVEPLKMANIEGAWYLNAYCRRAAAPRLFRLERILAASVTDERFERREDVEPKTAYEDIDPRSYAAHRAVVRFSPRVARWMQERPELDLLQRHEDGSADYAMYYTDVGWAASRVMQYLGEAAALEPEGLRREIGRRATELLERYRGWSREGA